MMAGMIPLILQASSASSGPAVPWCLRTSRYGCPSSKPCPAAKWLICQLESGENLSSRIILLLHVLRLLPSLCSGQRELALESLALRQQLAVYK
jgi:hypothetical protein